MNRAKTKRLIKFISIAAIIIILVYVGLSYLRKHMNETFEENLNTEYIDDKADLALGRVDQTSTRDGRDEWRLTADVATYTKSSDMMNLANVMVYFYFESGETGTLTADKGSYQTATQNFAVNDNVIAKASGYELTTPELLYIKDQDTLIANERSVITSGDSYLEADYMLLEIKNQKVFMEGNVKVFLTPEFMESPPAFDAGN